MAVGRLIRYEWWIHPFSLLVRRVDVSVEERGCNLERIIYLGRNCKCIRLCTVEYTEDREKINKLCRDTNTREVSFCAYVVR